MFWRILSRFLLWKSTALSPVKVRFNFRVSVCVICYPQLDEIEGMTPRLIFPLAEIYAKSGQIGMAAFRTAHD
jgi:hypothetical protein